MHVQIAVAQAQQLRAELIAAGCLVLLDKALLLQRAQYAVRGALGQPQSGGDVGQSQTSLTTGEQA
ncbi:hypothetical protein SANTM175S_07376 [Streptomyces antimycoticus]